MPQTSERTGSFTESVIRRMTRVANQYNAINLSQGFPDFDCDSRLVDAVERTSKKTLRTPDVWLNDYATHFVWPPPFVDQGAPSQCLTPACSGGSDFYCDGKMLRFAKASGAFGPLSSYQITASDTERNGCPSIPPGEPAVGADLSSLQHSETGADRAPQENETSVPGEQLYAT